MKNHLLAFGAFAMLGLGFGASSAVAAGDPVGSCENQYFKCQRSCTAQGYTGSNNICLQFCVAQFAACGGFN